MSTERKNAREAIEAAYVERGDRSLNKYELFASTNGLPEDIDDSEAVSIAASVLATPPDLDDSVEDESNWSGVDFTQPNADVYPPEMVEYDSWMVHKGNKLPYAPWTGHNSPAPCSKHGSTAAECECSARYKWGWEPNRVAFKKARMALDDHRLKGLVFIQTEDDPFVFVDGDDVRCPMSGEVHPAFIAFLEHFGYTYADISTSGTGAHAVYRGDLPGDETRAVWDIDTEPWGANDDKPTIEIYSGKHVNVTTGDQAKGAADSVAVWNAETAHKIVRTNGCVSATPRDELREAYRDFETKDRGDTANDHIVALRRLDARRVAERTIVKEWTDTNRDLHSFLPVWGDRQKDGGTANIVDKDFWVDSGDDGGSGGPIEMALIDMAELGHKNAKIGCAKRSDFWTGYEHLIDLGFNLPDPPYAEDTEPTSDYYNVDLESYTDGDPWSDPNAMLTACLAARADGVVSEDAEPPTLAIMPILRDLLGVTNDPGPGTKKAGVDVFHEMAQDDFTKGEVTL